MKRREIVLVCVLIFIVLAARLYFTLTSEHFTYDAYFHIRIIEHISENLTPPVYDELSYGGRYLAISPLFHYIMAFFTLMLPGWLVYKVIPQVFMAAIPLVVLFTVMRLTNRFDAAYFSAWVSAFIPITFTKTLYSVSPLSLALPLTYAMLLFFFYVPKRVHIVFFLIMAVLVILVHPSSIFLILGLLAYLLISKVAGMRVENSELELIFFTTFIYLWINFLLYRDALLLNVFSQNIPGEIISRYFTEVSIVEALLQLGIVPIIAGIYTAYRYLFNVKNKYVYLYSAMILFLALFAWLKIIRPDMAFLYLAVALSILSGPAYEALAVFMNKIRFRFIARYYIVIVVLLVGGTLVVPSIVFAFEEPILPQDTYDALVWLKNQTGNDVTVLSTVREGHAVAAVAQRKNVADDYFTGADDVEARLKGIRKMYTSPFPTEYVEIIQEYSVDYILLTPYARELYSFNPLIYRGQQCINKVYNKKVVIYRVNCRLDAS